MSSSDLKPTENANAAFTFKKFMGNVASTSKLFAPKTTDSNSTSSTIKPTKTVSELEDEIEILKLQKSDLRKLCQERTYELDQLKKLDSEHQKLRKRWKDNEEKSFNDVQNIESHCSEIQNELLTLRKQNNMLQSKQTANSIHKNKLQLSLTETLSENEKYKKLIEKKDKEKKMLVTEVLKLRNEKQELITAYKNEIDKLNKNNKNNISHMSELHIQQTKSKQIEFSSQINNLKHQIEELNILYNNYKTNMKDKIVNIDSTTNAFDAMITNANIGNLSQEECNKILDNIINSIEHMENENENYKINMNMKNNMKILDVDSDDDDDKNDMDTGNSIKGIMNGNHEIILNRIESRMLKSLREKGLLQRSTNGLMFQLQELQNAHEKEIKVKDDAIYKHELRAKVKFFGNKVNKTNKRKTST